MEEKAPLKEAEIKQEKEGEKGNDSKRKKYIFSRICLRMRGRIYGTYHFCSDFIMKKLLIVFFPIAMLFCTNMTAQAEETDTCISETAQNACHEIGGDYGIKPELLMAIIETESRGKSDAVGGNCLGLMQINPKWHKDRMERLGVTDLFDEYGNILVGADLLAELRDEYQEISLVLDIYHGSSKAFQNYENGVVSDYARKILERSAELEELNERSRYGNV